MPRRDDISKVMIVGSSPMVVGQPCDFDRCTDWRCARPARFLDFSESSAMAFTAPPQECLLASVR